MCTSEYLYILYRHIKNYIPIDQQFSLFIREAPMFLKTFTEHQKSGSQFEITIIHKK